jgi:hypothetical protein
MLAVEATGPLFEGKLSPQLIVGVHIGASRIAAAGIADMRAVLGRFRRGPARYGHIASAARAAVITERMQAGDVGVRVYLGGPSAFLGPILEGGTTPPYKWPLGSEGKVSGTGNKRGIRSRKKPLALHVGGNVIFRQTVDHPAVRAFRWLGQVQATLEPKVQPLLEDAIGQALEGAS